MADKDKNEPIPGIKKDYEEDFKTALLKARGILNRSLTTMKKLLLAIVTLFLR